MNATPILPPTARDFEIHRLNLVEHISTYRIAEKHAISQTRVRQIIKRVCDWLAEALPVKTEAQQEQETRLAQHLAAEQLRHQIEQLQIFWDATSDPKYLRQQTRAIAALSRLGIVPGTIDALAADATEGPESGAGILPAKKRGAGILPAKKRGAGILPATNDLVTRVPPGNALPRGSSLADATNDSRPDRVTRVPPGNALPRGSSLAESPTGDCSANPPVEYCSPPHQSQLPEHSTPVNQSTTTPSTPETSDDHNVAIEYELPGLNLLEQRLLTVLQDTPASDQEKRQSLEQTLSNVRREKAALELRISSQMIGATVTIETPSLNTQPQAQAEL